ncbi:MAG: septum formation protein Maf [Labilithrix sp.]|nr:septum formation protein Maf [Labilithrix sp.]MCW5814283.1 septum formation protein Maf [Labilithrix sp.]
MAPPPDPAIRAPLSEGEPLLLASASPRRREIMNQIGIPSLVSKIDVDEDVRAGESPDAYLVRIVLAKLAAASKPFAQGGGVKRGDTLQAVNIASAAGAVLVADTSVIDDGAILGKPADDAEAEAMIARLAGKTHEVWTRFAIGAPESPARALHEETVKTKVTFRALSSEQVRAYVASGEGKDKAGAYAVQGRGAALVSRIDGSYSNVVGLPACEVVVALERLGLWI